MRAKNSLRLHVRDSRTWVLRDEQSGEEWGEITYIHDATDAHYQAWVIIEGHLAKLGEPLPQLKQAARAIEHHMRAKTAEQQP